MNDIERAIEIIVGISNDYKNESEQDTSLCKAVNALEKQIPKKTTTKLVYGRYAKDYCPVCKSLMDRHTSYCPDCGQKLLHDN